ncbi:MAG: S66 family peptidase [Nakamurella sp.]
MVEWAVQIRYPVPLRAGDTIGVTAPSAGVPADLRGRLEFAVNFLRDKGFVVVIGDCLDGAGAVSAPKQQRAAELNRMLTDPQIRAIVPPWGGELAIDLLDLLDYRAIALAEPTWLIGYSDCTTLMVPLTLRTGLATLHGSNLMDTPYRAPPPLAQWWEVAATAGGGSISQGPVGRYRAEGFDRWQDDPTITELTLDTDGGWSILEGLAGPADEVDVTGRLIGGCIETLTPVAGAPFGDVAEFGEQHADDGLLVYLEAADAGSFDVARALHGFRLHGWFDHARAVLIGRTRGPGHAALSQHGAVRDALGMLNIPIVVDVDCGHVPPYMPIVNGAMGRLVGAGTRWQLTETFC